MQKAEFIHCDSSYLVISSFRAAGSGG